MNETFIEMPLGQEVSPTLKDSLLHARSEIYQKLAKVFHLEKNFSVIELFCLKL